MKGLYLYAIGIWFVFAVAANINGLLRVFGYGRFVPELTAHQISTGTFLLLMTIVMYYFFRFLKHHPTSGELLIIGIGWVLMTVAFEFLFGHYVIGHSWEHLLRDYNILKGRLWSLVLLWTLIGPLIIGSVVSGDLSIGSAISHTGPAEGR